MLIGPPSMESWPREGRLSRGSCSRPGGHRAARAWVAGPARRARRAWPSMRPCRTPGSDTSRWRSQRVRPREDPALPRRAGETTERERGVAPGV